ncbi:carboxynorspermidine decarboxylase [Persicobacter sp. CCB-QB2]|uniref:carboxynorspermidine decarboxylase n=1 Tax=Persicobacter sp. CCB-QB2 TaxID=1561025 RepID=UPI0006A9C9BB|nr:carboxynorspermidine decarboxylase [Persicobacter sp. CCB-QB2]
MENILDQIPSPCFVLEEVKLRENLRIIRHIMDQADVEFIVAFKGYAMWSSFPILREYINTSTASSLHEARLCFEEMKNKAHTYAPAYSPFEIEEILSYSSHITFNSLSQWERFKKQSLAAGVSPGLRVNPEYSEIETDLYNPASPTSRLGMQAKHLADGLPEGIKGLHFHALCENNSFTTEKVIAAFEAKYGHFFNQLEWVNFGGGHLVTKKDYDHAHLIRVLKNFRAKYPKLKVYLEPGSAFGWETGFLKSTVMDVVENGGFENLIMDVSFTAHMPDCLEMPYRPAIRNAHEDNSGKFHYRIGGGSCLAGDFMEEYGFDQKMAIGDTLIFEDMIHYTMVKTTTFNGVQHPSIGMIDRNGQFQLIRKFGYDDYKNRLS